MTYSHTYGDEAKELVPGTLRGYRTWRYNGAMDSLRSVFTNDVWHARRPKVATCWRLRLYGLQDYDKFAEPHLSPGPMNMCRCGIYATHRGLPPDYLSDAYPISGVIKAYGKIALGTSGFRAEKAEVIALTMTPIESSSSFSQGFFAMQNIGHLIAKCFDVPWFDNASKLLKEYPPDDLSGLSLPPIPYPYGSKLTVQVFRGNPGTTS